MATEVEQHVFVANHGGVGLIRFNRPEKMNAIGAITRQQLDEAIRLAPDGGVSWLLPRLAGTAIAYEMFFTGKPLSAADAQRLGVINRVVPQERLEEEVRELATQLASQPRQALAAAKRAVNHALESSYEEALEFESYLQEAQAASSEFAEGVQAFLARRSQKK